MTKKWLLVIVLSVLFLFTVKNSFAFWVWTPETNKWLNPKYAVKETPGEQLAYAREFHAAKEYKEAIREYNKLLKYYPKAREASEAQYFVGLCLEEQKKPFEAFKQYQMVIDKYPFSERSSEIVKSQYDIGVKLMEGEKSGNNKFFEVIVGEEQEVISIFRAVIKNAPYGNLAAPAQYKIGLYLLEKKQYQEARDEFEKVLNDYPDSEWTKAAKYQIAVSDSNRSSEAQYDQKVTESAIEEFKEFVEVYPDAEISKKAKIQIKRLVEKEAENSFLVAQFYEKQKNYKAAKIYYKIVVDQYRNSKWSSKALKKIQDLGSKE